MISQEGVLGQVSYVVYHHIEHLKPIVFGVGQRSFEFNMVHISKTLYARYLNLKSGSLDRYCRMRCVYVPFLIQEAYYIWFRSKIIQDQLELKTCEQEDTLRWISYVICSLSIFIFTVGQMSFGVSVSTRYAICQIKNA